MKPQKKVAYERASLNMTFIYRYPLLSRQISKSKKKMGQLMGMLWSAGN
jgi:hypothetical protein